MSAIDETTRYYDARAPVYDETAGYRDPEGERLREPIKARYRELFKGHDVLEIACGTGYWTAAIAEAANSVLATDVNASVIGIAQERCRGLPSVRFQLADAYALEGVPTGFTAGMAIWWWSHIPKHMIHPFLSALHSKLRPGSPVLFRDQLPYPGPPRRQDSDGNTLEQRTLPDGSSFEIVKNFPTEQELREALHGCADDVHYFPRAHQKHWELTYRTRGPERAAACIQ